jgi:hypothetical protein
MSTVIAWGHNPGQFAVKDTHDSPSGKRLESKPYPAVIAPAGRIDDMGITARSTVLEATVGDERYQGGRQVARLPNAIRQMAKGRLDDASPIYNAFAQMSFQHLKLARRANGELPGVLIATALPVSWRQDADASAALERHLRNGLRGKADVRAIHVRSEAGAVIYHELFDDDGDIRREQASLAKGLVCVGDLGGGTLNRAVLENLEMLSDQAQSPELGSRRPIEQLMNAAGISFVDAEERLRTAVANPGRDKQADTILKQYRNLVVSEYQQAWATFDPVAYLFSGGTVLWVAEVLLRAFGTKARIVDNPQQAVATGLYRYATRKINKG